MTDPEGDKIYEVWEAYPGYVAELKGEITMAKGTGKYEGIKGKGKWFFTLLSDRHGYADREWEVTIPGQ